MKIITYKDLSKENEHGFAIGTQSANDQHLIVKEGILPGMMDYPDMYIRHIKTDFNNESVLIISMTDYELTDIKRQEIVNGATELLEQ